jgi:hypothetical protein
LSHKTFGPISGDRGSIDKKPYSKMNALQQHILGELQDLDKKREALLTKLDMMEGPVVKPKRKTYKQKVDELAAQIERDMIARNRRRLGLN